MFMQSDHRRHSLANNLWAPLELAAAVAVISSTKSKEASMAKSYVPSFLPKNRARSIMKARDVMVAPVITVELSSSVREVAKTFLERRISAAPVVDDKD
jgi:CBS domain-containing protein